MKIQKIKKKTRKKGVYGTPTKDIYSIRQTIREELNSLLKTKSTEYEELRYLLKPTHLKAEIRAIIQNDLKDFKKELKKYVKKEGTDTNSKFRKQVLRMIEQQVKAEVLNADLHEEIERIIKQKLETEDFKELVTLIIDRIVKQMNRKLNNEYKLAKNLSYSIDSEIKHTLMEIPISSETEKIAKDKINKVLDNLSSKELNIKQIE